jgi:hypothetical protein
MRYIVETRMSIRRRRKCDGEGPGRLRPATRTDVEYAVRDGERLAGDLSDPKGL